MTIADSRFLWKSLSGWFMRMTQSVGDGCFLNSILSLFWVLFYKLFAPQFDVHMKVTLLASLLAKLSYTMLMLIT